VAAIYKAWVRGKLSSVSRLSSKPGRRVPILRKESTEYYRKNKTRFRKRERQKQTNPLAVLRCYLLGEDKGVPVHDMKIRCIAPLILHWGIIGRWAVNLTPRPHYRRDRSPARIEKEAVYASEAIWMLTEKRNIYFSCRTVWPVAWSWNRLHIYVER